VPRLCLVVLLLSLASCLSVNPKPVHGPHDKPAYVMECSGFGRSFEQCQRKAAELCPNGYDTFDAVTSMLVVTEKGGIPTREDAPLAIECK
jgi:hypothetical protein